MRPVDQTTFGVPGGNCFSACVASLLHVPIEEVPYFMDADDWIASLNEWLRTRGFYALYFRLTDAWRPAGYYILGGESERGPHAVIAQQGRVVHDPHPSRAGLRTFEDATILVPLDPANMSS